jgi:hypothetical protein
MQERLAEQDGAGVASVGLFMWVDSLSILKRKLGWGGASRQEHRITLNLSNACACEPSTSNNIWGWLVVVILGKHGGVLWGRKQLAEGILVQQTAAVVDLVAYWHAAACLAK